jgi:large subunit ribosomal protein L35
MKTHSGAKKRFHYTGGGRVRRPHAYHQHNFRQKSKRQKRLLRQTTLVGHTDEPRLRHLLPYGGR